MFNSDEIKLVSDFIFFLNALTIVIRGTFILDKYLGNFKEIDVLAVMNINK